jgi:hypothetical protein
MVSKVSIRGVYNCVFCAFVFALLEYRVGIYTIWGGKKVFGG